MEKILSVIVPVYKVEEYLGFCLDSLLNQTFKDMEIILVDDGSPDRCPGICDEYAKRDSRITVIHKKNEGVVNARKSGAAIAKGRYITFVDSDDWIEPDMYEVMAGLARERGADIIITDYYRNYHEEETWCKMTEEAGFYQGEELEKLRSRMIYSGRFYFPGIFPIVWNKWYKREILLPNLMAIDGRLTIGEDMACTYPCMLDASSVEIYKEKCFYHYRWRPGSMMDTWGLETFEVFSTLYAYLEKCFEEKNRRDIAEQVEYHRLYIILLLAERAVGYDSGKSLTEGIRELRRCYEKKEVFDRCTDVEIEKMKIPFFYKRTYYAFIKKRILSVLGWQQVIRVRNHILWLKSRR